MDKPKQFNKTRRQVGLRNVPALSPTRSQFSEHSEPTSTSEAAEEFNQLSLAVSQMGIDHSLPDDDSESGEESYEIVGRKPPTPKRYPKHWLLILDLNGVLVSRSYIDPAVPQSALDETGKGTRVGNFWVWKRPGLEQFLDYIFEYFHVAIWSSVTAKNIESLGKFALGVQRYNKLAFIFDQSDCDEEPHPTSKNKPLFKKTLQKVWDRHSPHDERDTIIVDNDEIKISHNPEGNIYVIPTWSQKQQDDSELFEGSEFRIFLSELLDFRA